MKHPAVAKRVSSCRHQRELLPAEASAPEAWFLGARRLEASRLQEGSRPGARRRRLSSFRLPEACLPEALERPAGSRPAVLGHREFDRERARFRKVRLARAKRLLQQASCLLGIRDQIFLAWLYDVRLNGLRKFISHQAERNERVCKNGEIIQIGGMTEKPFHRKSFENELLG